jgi:hypothetical protein
MKKSYILLAGLALSAACNDKGLDKVNPNELSVSTYFKTGSDIVAAVNAAYSSLQAQHLYGREYFFLHDTRSDEMQPGGGQLETHRAQLLNGVHRPDNQVLTQVWQGWYRVIHQANVVVDYAPKATQNVTEALKSRVIGEAKFLRAGLLRTGERVGRRALSTSVVTSPGPEQGPGVEDEVYAQVVSDLSEAIAYLPPKSEYSDEEIGRAPGRGAGHAGAGVPPRGSTPRPVRPRSGDPIGRVPPGRRASRRISGRKTSSTPSRSGSLFLGSVRRLQLEQRRGRPRQRNHVPGAGVRPHGVAQPEFLRTACWPNLKRSAQGDAKDDPRYAYSFYSVGDAYNNGQDVLKAEQVQGAEPKVSWKKYQKLYKAPAENFAKSGINFRVIRYAEVLLMMAEVENETGNPAKALEFLNAVRARADVLMPPYPTARFPCRNGEEVFAALAHEKLVELGGEQVRNRDLLRWRKLGKLKG